MPGAPDTVSGSRVPAPDPPGAVSRVRVIWRTHAGMLRRAPRGNGAMHRER